MNLISEKVQKHLFNKWFYSSWICCWEQVCFFFSQVITFFSSKISFFSYVFYFFAESFYLFFCWDFFHLFKLFVIDHWCIFRTDDFQILSENPNISIILVLETFVGDSIGAFIWFHLFLFLGRTVIFYWNYGLGYYVMRLWVLFKPSVFPGFLWHSSSKGTGKCCFITASGPRNQSSLLSSHWHLCWGLVILAW